MSIYNSNETIIVNGITMLAKDYRKMKRAKANEGKKKTTKRKKASDMELMSLDIKAMTKKVKLIKSLSAYYTNGYRQWGTIAKNIIQLEGIRKPFVFYNIKVKEMVQTLKEIEEISKRSEKAVYQYVEKLSYQLDDIRQYIDELCSNIIKSGVIERYREHECICGQGRRLGLKTLIGRSWSATMELNNLIRHCNNVSVEGVDAFAYTQETYNGMINCFSKKM